MERIWGPVNGFYLAAYAAPVADGEQFCSYAKVCWRRPDSYWDADCAVKIFGGEHHRSAQGALESVAEDAHNEALLLPSRSGRRARYRPRQPLSLSRLFATAFPGH